MGEGGGEKSLPFPNYFRCFLSILRVFNISGPRCGLFFADENAAEDEEDPEREPMVELLLRIADGILRRSASLPN